MTEAKYCVAPDALILKTTQFSSHPISLRVCVPKKCAFMSKLMVVVFFISWLVIFFFYCWNADFTRMDTSWEQGFLLTMKTLMVTNKYEWIWFVMLSTALVVMVGKWVLLLTLRIICINFVLRNGEKSLQNSSVNKCSWINFGYWLYISVNIFLPK